MSRFMAYVSLMEMKGSSSHLKILWPGLCPPCTTILINSLLIFIYFFAFCTLQDSLCVWTDTRFLSPHHLSD